ncbi:hypothetical protein PENTCL1PPCAC_4418, partial [Pristionchus entomophagus]
MVYLLNGSILRDYRLSRPTVIRILPSGFVDSPPSPRSIVENWRVEVDIWSEKEKEEDTVDQEEERVLIDLGEQLLWNLRGFDREECRSAARDLLQRMTAMTEEVEKRKYRSKVLTSHIPAGPSSPTSMRRHRSLHEKTGSYQKETSEHRVTFVDSVRPSSPLYCFVSELNFSKISSQLFNNPSSRKSALLIQAMRQQITVTSSKEYANRAIAIFAEKDVLSLKNRKQSLIAMILMGTDNGFEVKEQLCRFVNSIASFKAGRSYLLTVGGGKEMLIQLMSALKARRIHGAAQDHAIAAIEKLSVRPSVCRELLSLGFFDWLLPTIDTGRLSPYGAEFCAALLLNLTLSTNSPALLARHADQMLSAMASLLRMKNTGVCPFINGALYAAFAFGRIRARARETKFEVHLQAKLERADCAMDQLHIPFLLKQMKGETEMVRVPSSNGENEEDTGLDHCESEIESTDQLRPIGAELAGARLLLAKEAKKEAEDEERERGGGPPGTVHSRLRSKVRRANTKIGMSRPLSRSEPRRVNSAASQATFTVEQEARKPLTQPVALSQLAIALKTATEKEKENVAEIIEAKESKQTGRATARKTGKETQRGGEPSSPTKEDAKSLNNSKGSRELSTLLSSPSKSGKVLQKANSIAKDPKEERIREEKREEKKVEEKKEEKALKSSRRGIPLKVMMKEDEKKEMSSSPPFFPPVPVDLLGERDPVTGAVPNRIP